MSLSLRLNLKRYAERYHHHLLSDGARFKEAKEDDESDLNNTSESKNDVAAAAAVDSKQNQLFDSKRHKISLIGSGENGEKINANKKRDNGTTRSTIELLSGENKPSLASVFLLTDNKQQQAYSQFQVKPFRFELFEEERDEAVSKEQQHWILEKTIEFKLLTSQINTVNRNSNTTDKQFREEEQQQQEQLQQQQPESISLDVS